MVWRQYFYQIYHGPPFRGDSSAPDRLSGLARNNLMDTMVPICCTAQRTRRISLTDGPAAAAQARSQVQAAIRAWDVPVDPPTAALLTSELVTNAIRHGKGEIILLVANCNCGQFRVYVHDSSRSEPMQEDASAFAETGRGLMLVSHLSTDWGYYPTLEGKAVYFTLGYEVK